MRVKAQLPPNRACGSPAHGSPVGCFLIGIGSPAGAADRVNCSEPAQGVPVATTWTPLPGPPTSAPHQEQLAYSLARRHLARPACADRRTTLRESTFLPTFAQRGFALRTSRPPQIDPRQGTPPRHLQWTGVSAASALGRPTANMHYSAGSDSCRRSPPPTGLPAYIASPSRRSTPNHVMPPVDRFTRR